MFIIGRDPPFPSAKLSKHLEYRRWKDENKVQETIQGWSLVVPYIVLGGGALIAFLLKVLL